MPSPETLVQPIILLIDKDAPPSHTDAVKAVAAAAVDALAEDTICKGDRPGRDVWGDSLSGPFTKTVRRANPKQWAKLPPATGEAVSGSARAAAFRPVSYEDMDKAISRLQGLGNRPGTGCNRWSGFGLPCPGPEPFTQDDHRQGWRPGSTRTDGLLPEARVRREESLDRRGPSLQPARSRRRD